MTTEVRARGTSFSEQVAEEIRVLMLRRRITGRALAETLKVSPSWVSYRLTGQQPIDLNDLAEIAAALEVQPTELVSAALKGPTPRSHPAPGPQHHPTPHGAPTRPPNRPGGPSAGPGRTARTRSLAVTR